MNITEIPMNLIDEDTDQPRYQFDEESLEELMKSIAELGLLSPIKVRTMNNGRYTIIYGNRRYKACKMLDRLSIPCIVSTATDEKEIYLEQIAENLTREGFSPIEEAEAYDKLLNNPKFSSSIKFLSSKLGKPEVYIKNKCDLLNFGPAVKQLVVSGTEIRKDKLTEDQLKPIKDLPIEHRDPLALIIARDQIPVSDVKKIARLFKDKDISSNTKDKLLYKSGEALLETWSVFEHNKAERTKPVEPKTILRKNITENEEPEKNELEKDEAERNAPDQDKLDPVTITAIEGKLQQLLASLLSQSSLPTELMNSIEAIQDNNKENFLGSVNLLIENLEKHLAEWNKIRNLVNQDSRLSGSGPNR